MTRCYYLHKISNTVKVHLDNPYLTKNNTESKLSCLPSSDDGIVLVTLMGALKGGKVLQILIFKGKILGAW